MAGLWEEGTRLCCLIADGDHQVHRGLITEGFQAFGPMMADVNADLLHDRDRQLVDDARLRARTKDPKSGTTMRTQESFSHLGTG
jgi:hypothetical protein